MARADRPNFIVVLTDDQQFRAIGYNNPDVQTPNLDRLAREGVIFDRAYIATPICMASRASLMTGVYPQQHGAVALDTPAFVRNVVEEKRYPTLPQRLAEAGYDTAFCGKSHLGPPQAYGFAAGKEHGGTDDDEAFEFATDFIASRAGNPAPFLLWVATRQPHVPLLPEAEWIVPYAVKDFALPPNFMEAPPTGSIYNQGVPGEAYYRDSEYTRNYQNVSAGPPRTAAAMQTFMRAYYATITRLDAQIGALVETLQNAGLHEQTCIIFLSDNGYMLGNHGLGNKITMHEESVRVPMFIHGQGVHAPGSHAGGLVSSLDVFPTILELAGVSLPGHLAGRSLVPLLEDPRRNLREVVASECVGLGGAPGQGHRMVRTVQWKYVLTDVNEEYLFDVQRDPYELENTASAAGNGQVLAEMRAHLWEWMDTHQDSHSRPPQ